MYISLYNVYFVIHMQDRSCMCRIDPAHTIWFAVTVRVRVRVRVRVNVRARVSGSIL
jgi:hypothetical protein